MLHPRTRTSVSGPRHVRLSARGWPWPVPSPIPAAGASGLPARFHRAVRLALAAGVVAAGLCLVLGMTVLAVTIGARGRVPADPEAVGRAVQPVSSYRTAAKPGSSSGPGEAQGEHASLPLAGRTVAAFHGASQPSRAVFHVAKPGTWGLAWTLRCRGGTTGHLIVAEGAGPSAYAIEIDASERSGGGTSWYVRDPGRHSLAITSTCSWSVRIVLANVAAGG